MGWKVNKRELSEILGKTQQMIDKYQEQGMPYVSGEKGKANEYDTELVFDWFRHGEDIDYQKERARLTKEQADKIEMENAIQRKELIPAETIIQHYSGIANNIKNRLLSVPTRAATLTQGVENTKERKKIIDELIREALTEIGNFTIH